MDNKINTELELAKTKMLKNFETEDGIILLELTQENVAIVEAMIRNDSAYLKGSDKDAKEVDGKYGGSSAYWFTELKKILIDNKPTEQDYNTIISKAVDAVDRENSTHLNADKVGREEITKRICQIDRNKLVGYLREPDSTDLILFKIISEKTNPKNDIHKPRENPSFASKFCHYACFYLFDDECQDNYSIYDSVLKKVLPLYATYYYEREGKKPPRKKDIEQYEGYRKIVDNVIAYSGGQISRNGFDHLLWYYHKGRI